MQKPRLYSPDETSESEMTAATDSPVSTDETFSENPMQVLGLVHQLEEQAAQATSPEVRTQLLRAGCELLDAALKEMQLPAAA